MTPKHNNPDALDRAVSALRNDEPDARQLDAARDQVWQRMNAEFEDAGEQIRGCGDILKLLPALAAGRLAPTRTLLVEAHLRECVDCRRLAHAQQKQDTTWAAVVPAPSLWTCRKFAMAASLVVLLGLAAYFATQWFLGVPSGMRAKVQAAQGGIYLVADNSERLLRPGDELAEAQLVRTAGGAHAFIELPDGSVVEMNERTELSVNMRRRDTTVNLDQGRIIVQAAKRRTGHLYVVTPDARVAVTGTVFSVNAGMKGSRVAVIEGEVHVAHAGLKDVLHSGDQVATSASLTSVPVQDEIAWSRNLDKHLALLQQFARLQRKIEQIPLPGLRYSSAILNRVPADTMVYAAMPNIGDALTEANRIFQEQLQQSPVLREWWNGKHQNDGGLSFAQMVTKVHTLSQYLGDEVALVVVPTPTGEADAVVIAQARREGLGEYLQSAFPSASAAGEKGGIRVVDQAQLAAIPVNQQHGELLALVRPDFVLFSSNPRALQRMAAQLGGGGFPNTEFGQRIGSAYARGAGFLLAVNLQQLIAQESLKPVKQAEQAARGRQQFAMTGFSDARFLVAEHRDLSGVPDNRAVVDFRGARRGIASWLAAPAPMGSLEYVSANAGMAVSFVSKSPAAMMDDLMQLAAASEKDPQHGLAEVEAKLGINLRDDFAACFGGDVTFALDGPILPTPSWKVVAQVNDATRLQNTLERLIQAINAEAAQHGKPGVQLERNEANGRIFYVVRALEPRAMNAEVDYTFADGYMIAAPSRALVMEALRTKANNDSLARAPGFQALLPRDPHANFSALIYQNLAPVVEPIASQLTPSQLEGLREIAADTKPTVICAYGDESSIEVASASRLLPFDLNRLAISALMGGRERHR